MRLANISKEDTQNQFQDYRSLWLHHNTDKKKYKNKAKVGKKSLLGLPLNIKNRERSVPELHQTGHTWIQLVQLKKKTLRSTVNQIFCR